MASPTRREFVQGVSRIGLGLGAAGCLVSAGLAGCRPRVRSTTADDGGPGPTPASPPALTTFSAAAFATVSAVCERLLPRDQDPGAIDLGVPTYIDRALATPGMGTWRELILQVLPILDRQSRVRFAGKAFHQAGAADQDALLAAWQRGRGGDRRFFDAVLTLTLEGAFGDPKHGGNAGGRGFTLIGFAPGPPMHAGAHPGPGGAGHGAHPGQHTDRK